MTVAYLLTVYLLSQVIMKNRERCAMLIVSRIHNLILLVWSCIMFFGVVYHLYPHIMNYGLFDAIIVDKDNTVYRSIEIWLYNYYICKYYEMIDTLILTLKKKKIIFLHLFHHMSMPWSAYFAMKEHFTPSIYALIWNNLIHIFMYYYYFISTFKSSKNRIWWKQYLTNMQIIQFIGGLYTALLYCYYCFDFDDKSIFEYDYFFGPTKCTNNSNPWICVFQIVLVSSFLLLFIMFYINAYFKSKSSKQL